MIIKTSLLFSRKLEDSLKQKRYAKLVLFGAIAILVLFFSYFYNYFCE